MVPILQWGLFLSNLALDIIKNKINYKKILYDFNIRFEFNIDEFSNFFSKTPT